MGIVLLCLILGLAIAIERIIYLNLSTTNTQKLANNVEDALNSGGIEAAKEVCRNTIQSRICLSIRLMVFRKYVASKNGISHLVEQFCRVH